MQPTQERSKQRPVPVAVIAAVLTASAVVAGWVTYRYVINGSPPPQAGVPMKVESLPAPAKPANAGVRRAAPGRPTRVSTKPVGYVLKKPGSGIIVAHRGDAQLRAAPTADNSDYVLTLDFTSRQGWVTPGQWAQHILAERAASIENLARKMNLTDGQKSELGALRDQDPLTSAEEAELKALIKEWDGAPRFDRNVAMEKLCAAVAKIGEAHREAAKAALQTRVARIPQILSGEQIEAAEQYLGKPKMLVVRERTKLP